MGVKIDVLNADDVSYELRGEVYRAATRSVQRATRALEQDLEAQTRGAVRGNAWRAWKSAVYPRGDTPAKDPAGEVFGNGGRRTQGLIEYWSLPGTNRAVGNRYLAVPLRAALGTSLGRHISPRQWEGRFGAKLRPLSRPGKTPLLVADGAFGPGGFTRPGLAAERRRGGQRITKTKTVAVFELIEEQPHANRVSIGSAVERASRRMAEELAKGIVALR
ncbi:DUF6441 family protein [Rhizorhabdus sp.]|uniref:DUF6441 family protein n=1 Tax=Rhizorhabdus sp. TaxID=1968843 RepID=UPI00198B2CEE|nr:DUF6441 family protein [Rhizorhabdus sp.]MBD3762435.1 hypothetical protein [Rhizorhabdus sp.]